MTKRLTTEQLIGAMKEARTHDERLELLRNAGIGQLKKLGKIEEMAEFGRGWTVETLSVRILDQLESRYARIDAGEVIHGVGLFGFPSVIETPLLKAREEKRKNGEVLDEIILREDATPETSEPENPEEIKERFEIGKSYKDEETGLEIEIEKRTSRRIYGRVKGHKNQYYIVPIRGEQGVEIMELILSDGSVVKMTAKETATSTKNTKEATTMTVKELRLQAKAAGIKGYSRMKKAELEVALAKIATIAETSKEESRKARDSAVSVKSVMEELKAVGLNHDAYRAVLRNCPEDFHREMYEVVYCQRTSRSYRRQSKSRKNYYLDKLTRVHKEELPTEILRHYPYESIDWIKEEEYRGKYYAEWEEYLLGELTAEVSCQENEPETKIVEEMSYEEEMLRRMGEAEIEEIAKHLYGEDYVREMLIQLLKQGSQAEEKTEIKESRPVTTEEFKKAFDELEHGNIYVNIPEMRKVLNWSRAEFDGMLRELRDARKIELHVTDLTKFQPEEFFYDETDNSRMGMLRWRNEGYERLSA